MWFSIKFMIFFTDHIISDMSCVYVQILQNIYHSILEGGFNIYTFKNDCNYYVWIYLRCSIVYNFEILPTCKFLKNSKYISMYMHRNNCNFETNKKYSILLHFSIVGFTKSNQKNISLNKILMMLSNEN